MEHKLENMVKKSSGQRFVTVYNRIRCYGGPEEGGWYYTVYEWVYTKKCSTHKSADRLRLKLRGQLDRDAYVTIENRKELGKQDNTNEPRPYYC